MHTTNSSSVSVIIPAAGVGSRVGSLLPKQYVSLNGHTLLWHTVHALRQHPRLSSIMLAIASTDTYWSDSDVHALGNIDVIHGGIHRAESVLNALEALSDRIAPMDWVLVHDACRPCVSFEELERLVVTCEQDDVGGLLALPPADTLKRVADGRVTETVDRVEIWRALTPQMFRFSVLHDALRDALAAGVEITDESSAVEWAGHSPLVIEGKASNIKVTYPDDVTYVQHFLAERS